jgi:hypothetical protein
MIDRQLAIQVSMKLLLWGNLDTQMVYADIAPESAWDDYFVRIFCSPGPDEDGASVRVILSRQDGWRREHYSEVYRGFSSPRPHELEQWLREDMPFRWLRERCLESEILLRKRLRAFTASRFGQLSWLFIAATESARHLPGTGWYVHSGYHGGWNTYYALYRKLGDRDHRFGISEQGHLAHGDYRDMRPDCEFNWRSLMRRCPRPDLAGHLLASDIRMHLPLGA